MGWLAKVSAVTLASSALCGCLDPTQIELVISTDAACQSGVLDQVYTGIGVGPDAQSTNQVAEVSTGVCPLTEQTRIGSLVFTPHDDDEARLSFEVTTSLQQTLDECLLDQEGLPAHCIVARRTLSFLPQSALRVPIVMRTSCAGVRCDEGQTCVNGSCVDQEVDPEECKGDGCGEEKLPEVAAGWPQVLGATAAAEVRDLAVDADGNLFVLGDFEGELAVFEQQLDAAGGSDVFVLSYDPDGVLRWHQHFAGTGMARGDAIITGPDGEVYLSGRFAGELVIDNTAYAAETGSGGFDDAFVVRIDSSGDVGWVSSLGGTGGTAWFSDLVFDQGEVVAVGGLSGHVVTATYEWSSSQSDSLVTLFDAADGAESRTDVFYADGDDEALAVAVDHAGWLQATGVCTDDITTLAGVLEFQGDGEEGIYRAGWAYNEGAEAFGLHPIGIDASARPVGLATTELGDTCVAGNFSGMLFFVMDGANIEAEGPSDWFVACFDSAGPPTWYASVGESETHQELLSMKPMPDDQMALLGIVDGTVSFGSNDSPRYFGSDGVAPFVGVVQARAQRGDLLWAQVALVEGTVEPTALVGAGQDLVYVAGSVSGSVSFGGASARSMDVDAVPDLFISPVTRGEDAITPE